MQVVLDKLNRLCTVKLPRPTRDFTLLEGLVLFQQGLIKVVFYRRWQLGLIYRPGQQ